MKKTYMQPAMMLVKTETAMMICVSRYGETTNATSGNLSKRRGGIFGSDEEESSNGIW